MESQQLLTQGQVFQDKVLPGAKDRKYPAEQMYQTPKHDRILAECAPWTQAPKSLILRMYGIMASHSPANDHATADCSAVGASDTALRLLDNLRGQSLV